MIKEISLDQKNNFIRLGLQISDTFNKVYDLEEELTKDYSHVLIFEDDNIIKGFIHYYDLDDEINIINLVVDFPYRKKGIGSLLIKDVTDNANKKVVLEVNKDNIAALSTYKKCGFKEKGIRKGYYNGVDAITMVMEK